MERLIIEDEVFNKVKKEKEVYELPWSGGWFKITHDLPKHYKITKNVTIDGRVGGFYTKSPTFDWQVTSCTRSLDLLNDGIIVIDDKYLSLLSEKRIFKGEKRPREKSLLEDELVACTGKGFVGKRKDFYNPIYAEKGRLYEHFQVIDISNPNKILNFVSKYGLLGLYYTYEGKPSLRHLGATRKNFLGEELPDDYYFISFQYGELVSDFKSEVLKMRDLLTLCKFLRDNQREQIKAYYLEHWQKYSPELKKEYKNRPASWYVQISKEYVKHELAEKLKAIKIMLKPSSSGSLFEATYTCPSLYVALYFQLYKDITSGTKWGRCKECGNIFTKATDRERTVCNVLIKPECSSKRYARHSRADKAIKELGKAYRNKKLTLKEYKQRKQIQQEKLNR